MQADTPVPHLSIIAAENGHKEVVKLLLHNKANVNLRCIDGDNPIEAARRNHHLEIVKLLK